MSSDQLAALEAELGRITATLEQLSDADWESETRCPPMTVHMMAAHLLRQARILIEYPRSTHAEDEKDASAYYRYDPKEVSDGVLERAQQIAASLDPRALLAEWRSRWPETVETARREWPEDPVIGTPVAGIRLREYVKTRCLEAAVHHMDILDALGRPPDPDPEALAVTVGVLEGLLGAPLGETGMHPIDFVVAATGRRPLSENERDTLGPLADKFPVLQ